MSERPFGPDSPLDSLRYMYVISIRVCLNIIIIQSINYLQSSCQNLEAIIKHFRDTQNSKVYEVGNNVAFLYVKF